MADIGHRTSIAATVLLSAAALATSWAGYQASVWNGNQMAYANEGITLRTQSTRAATQAGLLRVIDIGVFTSWLSAYARKDTVLTQFYEQRFRPEFAPAFRQWMASNPLRSVDAPRTPFALSEYRLKADDDALRLEQAADSVTALATTANSVSDHYVLDAVLFATVMVFASAAQQQTRRSMSLFLLGLATAMCAFALVRVFTSPAG